MLKKLTLILRSTRILRVKPLYLFIFYTLTLLTFFSSNSHANGTITEINTLHSSSAAATTNPQNNNNNSSTVIFESSPEYKARPHSLGIGLGQMFLHGDFRHYGKNQIAFSLFYSYKTSDHFDFIADFHYSSHEYTRFNKQEREFDQTSLALGIKARPVIWERFSPYLLAGVGFYLPVLKEKQPSTNTWHTSDRTITFGVHAGAGVDLELNSLITVGLQTQIHRPFNINEQELVGNEISGHYYKLLFTTAYKF